MNFLLLGKKFLEKHPNSKKIVPIIYNSIFFNKIRIKGKNNKIIKSKSFIKKCNIEIRGNNNILNLGDMSYLIKTKITIIGNNNVIKLGMKDYITNGDFYIEDNDNFLKIKNRTTFAGNVHLALTEGKRITIGNECLFSSNVVIRTGDSHSILNSKGERTNFAEDVEIGNHVWITQNVTVLKGTKIPNNSIVGTGSVVTKKFEEENVLITGNPAKIIKRDLNWDKQRI